jgi:hypothetical protein
MALNAGKFCLWADTGMGKALRNGTKVLTESGWANIESLMIGDMVANDDGTFYPVKGVFPQGERAIYRITFSDRTSIDCDIDHIWSIKNRNQKRFNLKWNTLTTREIIQNGLRSGGGRKFFIPITKPIVYPHRDNLPIDPYTMGVLIGDGCFRNSSIGLTTDSEIMGRMILPRDISIKIVKILDCGYVASGYLTHSGQSKKYGRNTLLNSIREIGMGGYLSKQKFIPNEYMYASVPQRWALIQGLMDTDGSFSSGRSSDSGVLTYSTTSNQLADNFRQLIQSMGGTCCITEEVSPTYYYKGEKKFGSTAYRMVIKLHPDLGNPFRLTRKAEKYNPGNHVKTPYRGISSIKYVGMDDATCISVDSPNKLFVAENHIVTHNTSMQLSWADALIKNGSAKKVILLAPLGVAKQTIKEGLKFGINTKYCENSSDVFSGINVTNYEKLHKFDVSVFEAVILDESSILKNVSGSTRNSIIESFKLTPYKLACSATPSPNDVMELGSQCEFIGVMSRSEMLSMFFTHDGGETSKWRLKGHSGKAFWNFVSKWAVVIRSPSDLGYDASNFVLPDKKYYTHYCHTDYHSEIPASKGKLFFDDVSTMSGQSAIRRASMKDRCDIAVNLVKSNPNKIWLIWCETNDESTYLSDAIGGSIEVKGADSPSKKESAMMDFAEGLTKVLITKPKIAGMGMNFQVCSDVIYIGLTHSFEAYYQSVRRVWRYGQKEEVSIHIIQHTDEGSIIENLKKKELEFNRMAESMALLARRYSKDDSSGTSRISVGYTPNVDIVIPEWVHP